MASGEIKLFYCDVNEFIFYWVIDDRIRSYILERLKKLYSNRNLAVDVKGS